MRWLIIGLLILAGCGALAPESPACCKALTASCLACMDGISEEEYCEIHPEIRGCETPLELPEEEPVLFGSLFSYGELESFTYRADLVVVTALVTTDVKKMLSHGKPSFELRTTVTDDSTTVVMFVDPVTGACTSTHLENEDEEKTEDLCPVEGLNSKFAGTVGLSVGDEEFVTVLAGAFDTTKYSGDGITYWVAENVPVPVKYVANGYTMELVSYE